MMTRANDVINWIKDYYKDNPDGKAIIGISGGKDSTIAAALCVEALGPERVIGVLMPNGPQIDIADSIEVCSILGIQHAAVDIALAYNNLSMCIAAAFCEKDEQPLCTVWNNSMITTNLPARLRMATLYAVAALYPNSRVVNTCNRSEDYVGYSTKFGDAAGDFSPLGNLTVREVLAIGDELGLPEHLVHKAPSDGMCGKTDEDNLGFTYEQLDDYILGTAAVDVETVAKIERLHKATRHKYQPMPTFSPDDFCALPGQMSMFDGKPYADGGLVAPEQTGLASTASGQIGLASGQTGASAADYVGLLNDTNMSGNIGGWTIDTMKSLEDSTQLEKVAEAIQKAIETAGYGLFKEER